MPNRVVVLDTNVLISSLWRGRCWEVIKWWRDGHVTLAVSPVVLDEYLKVLNRFLNRELLEEWRTILIDPSYVLLVRPTEAIHCILEDPSDNRFLECAIAAHADVIVSGDHYLLKLKIFRDIPILTPATFLKRLPL